MHMHSQAKNCSAFCDSRSDFKALSLPVLDAELDAVGLLCGDECGEKVIVTGDGLAEELVLVIWLSWV